MKINKTISRRRVFIKETKSVCNVCLKKIPAEVLEKNGKIVIEKHCKEHGDFTESHFWDDPEIYNKLSATKASNPNSSNLCVVLTDKCNLNCPVCYARANEFDTPDFEMEKIIDFGRYKGILLTGGEPTVRKDLPQIIKKIRKKGKRVTIFTNGIKLADREYFNTLKKAGLSAIILQFDTLSDKMSSYVRGKNLVEIKLRAMSNAERLSIPFFLYAVILRKKKLSDIRNIIKLGIRHPVMKMISFNTLGRMGRCEEKDYLPASEIIKQVCKEIGITKKDWIESSRFLNTFDGFTASTNKRRLFSKCSLKFLVLRYKGTMIPITKIFNVAKVNRDAEVLFKNKNGLNFVKFILRFFISEIAMNFLRNRNFRIFLISLMQESKNLFKKNLTLLNPFFIVAVTVVPSAQNVDEKFIRECNIHVVTQSDQKPRSACLYRIGKPGNKIP